jgi:hypothetical protein
MPDRTLSTPLDHTFERYFQYKGKGHGGDGENYPQLLYLCVV